VRRRVEFDPAAADFELGHAREDLIVRLGVVERRAGALEEVGPDQIARLNGLHLAAGGDADGGHERLHLGRALVDGQLHPERMSEHLLAAGRASVERLRPAAVESKRRGQLGLEHGPVGSVVDLAGGLDALVARLGGELLDDLAHIRIPPSCWTTAQGGSSARSAGSPATSTPERRCWRRRARQGGGER